MSERFECVDCGEIYTLGYDHQRWYKERGMELPKRCDTCLKRGESKGKPENKGLSGPPRWPTEFYEEHQPEPPLTQPESTQTSVLGWLVGIGLVVVFTAAAACGLLYWLGWL